MVSDIKNDNVREILFVDYGNSEDVNVADIRHFSNDLKNIPILSVTAQFEGKKPFSILNDVMQLSNGPFLK